MKFKYSNYLIMLRQPPSPLLGVGTSTQGRSSNKFLSKKSSNGASFTKRTFGCQDLNNHTSNRNKYLHSFTSKQTTPTAKQVGTRRRSIPIPRRNQIPSRGHLSSGRTPAFQSRSKGPLSEEKRSSLAKQTNNDGYFPLRQTNKIYDKSNFPSRKKSTINNIVQVAEVQVNDNSPGLEQQDTLNRVIELKKSRLNGPMPNLLANEIRKYTGTLENRSENVVNFAAQATKSYDNSDLYKVPSQSTYRDLNTHNNTCDQFQAQKVQQKKATKKKHRSFSPFERLFRNAYHQSKTARRNPSAQLSQFTSYSQPSATQLHDGKGRKSRNPSFTRRRSISNVSKQSDAYNKSTRCLSINFPNRVDSKLSYNAGPGSAYFGGLNGHRVEQILVSPPESHLAVRVKSQKKKSKSRKRSLKKRNSKSIPRKSSSELNYEFDTCKRSRNGLNANVTGTSSFIRNSKSQSRRKTPNSERRGVFAQRKSQVEKWMRLMQGGSVVKPKRVISVAPILQSYHPSVPKSMSLYASTRNITPKRITFQSTSAKVKRKSCSVKRKKSIKRVKNSASLSRARRNIKQRDLVQQQQHQMHEQSEEVNPYMVNAFQQIHTPGNGLIQQNQQPYEESASKTQSNFVSEPDFNNRTGMINNSFGNQVMQQQNLTGYQSLGADNINVSQTDEIKFGATNIEHVRPIKPYLATESSQRTLSVENYQINENHASSATAINHKAKSGQANFWTSQNRIVNDSCDSDSSSTLDEYNLNDAARAVMRQPYLARKMQYLQKVSNPATREVTIMETPDYTNGLPTPTQKLNQHSSSCTLGPCQSMIQNEVGKQHSKKKSKNIKSMASPKSSAAAKFTQSEQKKTRKVSVTSAGRRKVTKSRSKSNKSKGKSRSASKSKSRERSHSRKSGSRVVKRQNNLTGGNPTREGTILYSPSASGSYVYAPNQILQNNSRIINLADEESFQANQYPEHFTKSFVRPKYKTRVKHYEPVPNEKMLRDCMDAWSVKREKRAAMNEQLREEAREQLKQIDERQPNRLQQLKDEMQFSLKAIRQTQAKLTGKPATIPIDRETIEDRDTQASSRLSLNEKVNRYADRIDCMLQKQYDKQMSKLQDRRLKAQMMRNRAEKERKLEESLQYSQKQNLTLDHIENAEQLKQNSQNLDLVNTNGLMYHSQNDLTHLIEEKEAEIQALKRQNMNYRKSLTRNTSGKKSKKSHTRVNSRLSQNRMDVRSEKSLTSNKKSSAYYKRSISRGSAKKLANKISCRSSIKTLAELQSKEDIGPRYYHKADLHNSNKKRARYDEINKLTSKSSELQKKMKKLMRAKRSPSVMMSQKSALSDKTYRSDSPNKLYNDKFNNIRDQMHSRMSRNSHIRSSSRKPSSKLNKKRRSLSKGGRNSRNYTQGCKTDQVDLCTSKNSTIVHKCAKSGQLSAARHNKKASKSSKRKSVNRSSLSRSKSKKKRSSKKSRSKSRRNSNTAFMRTQDGWPSRPTTIENMNDMSVSANDIVGGVQLFNTGFNMMQTATSNTLGDTYNRQSDYARRLRFNMDNSSNGVNQSSHQTPYNMKAYEPSINHQQDMNVQEVHSVPNMGSQYASSRSGGAAFNILTAQGMTGSGFVNNQTPGLVYNTDHRLNQQSGTFENNVEYPHYNNAYMGGSNVPSQRNQVKSKYNSILKNSSAKVGLTSSIQGSQRSWSPRDEADLHLIRGFNSQSKKRAHNKNFINRNTEFSDFSDSDDSDYTAARTRNQDKVFVNKVHQAVRSKNNFSGGTATFANRHLSKQFDTYKS